MFIRRLGPQPGCAGGDACPDILELETGDFAVIGSDITGEAAGKLPQGSGCGKGEKIVRIPRNLLTVALSNIASKP
jgi:hypothetical protein